MNDTFSLTPGFSPVALATATQNRFNGFPRPAKPLKRLARRAIGTTPLKRGVNETRKSMFQPPSRNGARRSRRFNLRKPGGLEFFCVHHTRTVKRRERRAPIAPIQFVLHHRN